MNKKSIILLSGGLDSAVSLASSINDYNINLALTFDYGQKSSEKEIYSSKMLASFYNIEHKIIKLDWLKQVSNSSLNNLSAVPDIDEKNLDNSEIAVKTANSVWVPNRNGLFVNIAASFADALNYTHIIIGANKEEGATFKDNTMQFVTAVNNSLKNSTNNNVELFAPLISLNKAEIVQKGINLNVPFKFISSCYNSNKKHCGHCESCRRLKRALVQNNKYDIIKELFE